MSSSAGVCSGGQAACLGGTLHALRPQPCARPLGFCTLGVTKVLASAGLCLPPAGLSMSHCRLSILRVRGESEAGRAWQKERSWRPCREFSPKSLSQAACAHACSCSQSEVMSGDCCWPRLLLLCFSSSTRVSSCGRAQGMGLGERGLMLEMVHACGVEVEECRPVQDRSGVRTCGTRD